MVRSVGWQGRNGNPRALLEAALMDFGPQWMMLADLRIDAPPDKVAVDYVLVHPDRGVALVNLAPGRGARQAGHAPADGFWRFLQGRGFDTFFPGHLPIAEISLEPRDVATLRRRSTHA